MWWTGECFHPPLQWLWPVIEKRERNSTERGAGECVAILLAGLKGQL